MELLQSPVWTDLVAFAFTESSPNASTVQALLLYARLKMRSRNDNRYALNIQFLMPYESQKYERLLSHTGTIPRIISFHKIQTENWWHTACVRILMILNYHTPTQSERTIPLPHSRYATVLNSGNRYYTM